MKPSYLTKTITLLIVTALSAAAFAAVPRTINYQGYLKGSAGAPVNSATNMTFSLYSTTNGAGPIWNSGTVNITPVNGIYSVELGKSPQPELSVAFDRQYWLGVQAGSDPEMRPLQPLTSAPYAIRALEAGAVPDGSVTATKLADGSVTAAKLDTSYVIKSGDTMTGALNLPSNGLAVGTNQMVVKNGNVGIGTATPATRLSVSSTSGFLGDFSGGTWWGVLRLLEGTTLRAYLGYGDAGGFLLNSLADSTGLYAVTGGLHLTANVDAAKGITVTPAGSIGVGTTAPGARLHLKGNNYPDSFMFLDTTAAAQDSGLRFLESGVTKSHLYWSAAAQTLKLQGSGASGLDITSTGKVGIGTASPAYKVHAVETTINNDNPAIYGEHAVTDNFGVGVSGKGSWKGVVGTAAGAGSGGYIGVHGVATAINTTGSTYGGYFAASGGANNYGIYATGSKHYLQGNVGLGTTAPGARLHLKGAGYPDSFMFLDTTATGQDSGIRFYENGIDTAHLFWGATSSNLKLYGKGFSGVDITSTGNVGIGTGTPADKLHVWGNYLRVEGAGGEKAYIGGDGAGGDVQIGSMNAGVNNVAMYNAASGQYMSVYLKNVHVMGGADLAEPFESADADRLEPGMVMAIDPENPGQLVMADKAYDTKVAGIVSGANGITAGVTMVQEGSVASGTVPVALTGRVYAWADASYGAIEPGNLLTTSDTPGHAMKVSEHARAQGAIIGKAMSRLSGGKGLVLVLVTLQ